MSSYGFFNHLLDAHKTFVKGRWQFETWFNFFCAAKWKLTYWQTYRKWSITPWTNLASGVSVSRADFALDSSSVALSSFVSVLFVPAGSKFDGASSFSCIWRTYKSDDSSAPMRFAALQFRFIAAGSVGRWTGSERSTLLYPGSAYGIQ